MHTPLLIQIDHADPATIRAELLRGLHATPATISPKFLYDALGARLFAAICRARAWPTESGVAPVWRAKRA